MKLRNKVLVGLTVATLALGTVAGVSFAADSTSTPAPAKAFANGCRGFFGGAADALSKLLGLKPEEIVEKRNAGNSLADIAKEQGVEKKEVVDTILEARKKFLDERVKAGIITQEQADYMLQNMKARVESRIENDAVGCGGGAGMGRGGCGGPGMGRGGYGAGARGGYGPGAYRNAPAGYSATPGGTI